MPKVNTVTVELQRPGPPHNQLLSPLTPYLAMCSSRAANTVYLDFEQQDFLLQAQGLDYGLTPQFQQAQLGHTGSTMGRLLSNIRSLATVIAEAADPNGDGSALIHLRLISDAAELAMLPFEAAIAATGFPGEGQPLLLQSDAPICLTRESRKPEYRELDYFRSDQKILFAYAEFPGSQVPARAHLLALRRAIDPWCGVVDLGKRLDWVRERITVLPNATLEGIREACAAEHYQYVHILAHGMPRAKGLSREQEFGLALHDSSNPRNPDFIDGARLAGALCGYDRLNQTWWCPKVVTLAACDSGHQGSLMVPGGSVAHALHLAGVPLVVASQFPLTIPGSALLIDVLYAGLLWGEDPFVLLHEVRRRLHLERRDGLDWASLVAYSNWPASLASNNLTFQYNQAVRALVAFDHRLRARFGERSRQPQESGQPALSLRKDLERVREFRSRMEQIAPTLRQRVTSYLHDIAPRSALLAEHDIDVPATRLQAQALIRQSDLEYKLGLHTWRQPLKDAYRAISELHTRSHARQQPLSYRELMLLIKLSVFLTRRVPEKECAEALAALNTALAQAKDGPGPILASPPELWLHAAMTELIVLQARTEPPPAELAVEVQRMCDLVDVSEPDDVDQVTHSYERMVGWWAKDLPPYVLPAAQFVVNQLKIAADKKRARDASPVSQPLAPANIDPLTQPATPPHLGQAAQIGTRLARELAEGRSQLLRINGEDNRRLERNPASIVPLCWLCRITARYSDGTTEVGTGWLAGPRLIVTAAHVVCRTESATIADSVSIRMSRNSDIQEGPEITLVGQEAVRIPNDVKKESPSDYAVIMLPLKDSQDGLGHFGFDAFSPERITRSQLTIAGYPRDIPRTVPATEKNRGYPAIQKGAADKCDSEFIGYLFDTTPGQSGSPLWFDDASRPNVVVGIHIMADSSGRNAILITPQIISFIDSCRHALPVAG